MFAGEGQAVVRTQHGQHGGQRVGLHALGMQHRHRGQRVADRLAGARIEGVRPAPSLVFADVPAVSRGRDRQAVERHTVRGPRQRSRQHLPRVAGRVDAGRAQFAADLDQEIGEPECLQRGGDLVDREALGDARQVERRAAGLETLRVSGSSARRCQRTRSTRLRDRAGEGGASVDASASAPKPQSATSGPTLGSMAPSLAAAHRRAQASTLANSGASACRLPAGARLKRSMSESGLQVLIWATTRSSAAGRRAHGIQRDHAPDCRSAATRSCPWCALPALQAGRNPAGAAGACCELPRPRSRSGGPRCGMLHGDFSRVVGDVFQGIIPGSRRSSRAVPLAAQRGLSCRWAGVEPVHAGFRPGHAERPLASVLSLSLVELVAVASRRRTVTSSVLGRLAVELQREAGFSPFTRSVGLAVDQFEALAGRDAAGRWACRR